MKILGLSATTSITGCYQFPNFFDPGTYGNYSKNQHKTSKIS